MSQILHKVRQPEKKDTMYIERQLIRVGIRVDMTHDVHDNGPVPFYFFFSRLVKSMLAEDAQDTA